MCDDGITLRAFPPVTRLASRWRLYVRHLAPEDWIFEIFEASGEASTRFPPGKLVELSKVEKSYLFSYFSYLLNARALGLFYFGKDVLLS